MKRTLIGALVVLGIGVAMPALAARHTKDSLDTVERNLTARRAILVDVREDREASQGYIDGAILVPLSLLTEGEKIDSFGEILAQRLNPEAIIYVYSASGKRCLTAADILTKIGFQARALPYGYQQLVKEGFVTAKPKK